MRQTHTEHSVCVFHGGGEGTKRKLELTPRLQSLADWVKPGAKIADIGTDHGYLPVWLILHGRVSSAVASDLRLGPLSRACETAAENNAVGRLEFKLRDGLCEYDPKDADTIIIAGMGGENIAAILEAAPWTADGAHTLLLQPMSRAEVLRRFLEEHGYAILREQVAADRETLYVILEVGKGSMKLSPGQQYGGAALLHDPLGDRYLIEKVIRLQNAVAGLNRSGLLEDAEKADHLRDIITSLLEMREEWHHANCRSN